jgi:hypothetical protein
MAAAAAVQFTNALRERTLALVEDSATVLVNAMQPSDPLECCSLIEHMNASASAAILF